MYVFSRSKVTLIAKLLALIVTVTILIIPVLLFYLTPMTGGAKAGIVLVFVISFGALMSLFTMARLESILVGTCTYCAVLVTFLGSVQVRNSASID
jgi:hypothetical protein